MNDHHPEDPLARYLADMLADDEGAVNETVEMMEAPVPVAPESTRVDRPSQVDWWGFGVAHLILVLPGEQVRSVTDEIPVGMDWLSDRLLQGRHRLQGESRVIVDPACLILPEAHRRSLPPLSERASGLVHLADGDLTLIAGSEPLPVSLEADEVRWRQEPGSRPWLAGTIMNRSMVVLDIPGLLAAIESQQGD
ncbi:hypothetical protein [Natronospira bacteriovora]|uniref:CheW-like domain-containing protein n=1 Tax=Natronospira bacteriovora TaxID=3069753 RepID=A0ABU0W365_9GAMM|nr:hypothetical protein [Natronospira sp. AB-CW4]MDQ2068450.1 hypothetical protein [Natronospira sp. AB-CW4]